MCKKFRHCRHFSTRHQSGLTLVELMIGMLVGLILIGGVIQTLLVSKDAQRSRQNMATVTENARFMFDFMTRDMRIAGRNFGDAGKWDDSLIAVPIQEVGGVLQLGYYTETGGGEFVYATYSLDAVNNRILYSRTGLTNNAEVLIEGVGQFDLEYGVHRKVGNDYQLSYVGAAEVVNWSEVGSVRLTLGFVDDNRPGKLRSLTSTMALRNRIAAIYSPE